MDNQTATAAKIHGSLVTEVKALVATTTFANDTKHRGHQRL